MNPDEQQLSLPIWDNDGVLISDEPAEADLEGGAPSTTGQRTFWPKIEAGPEKPSTTGRTEDLEQGKEGLEQRTKRLEELREESLACNKCPLRAGCTQVVFGEGNPHAKLMFVGEGPGEQEDIQGRPFVGAAGQLLDKILASVGISRDEVYIANVVKCRPPGNRLPTAEEAAACLPHLLEQIRAIKPKIIVCLGALATQTLIDKNARITRVRGTWFEKNGILYMPTFHPAALLRDETKKRPVWEDMKKVREALDKLQAP